MRKARWAILAAAVCAVLLIPAGSFVYELGGGEACARCHEIQGQFKKWQMSSHRGVKCTSCHGDALTFDAGFHMGNIRRLVKHVSGNEPDQIRIKTRDVAFLMPKCKTCHQQEFAQWQTGPHSVTYANIFLDEKHNKTRRLMDDCFRCHGMHFDGAIGDLVTPVSVQGPWTLRRPELAGQPAIPCMACHQMHREGEPLKKTERQTHPPGKNQEIARPSLALFDRRSFAHAPAMDLPIPAMLDGTRPVRMSPDHRQALCYQCHAPLANRQVKSGDDRTGIGVHEGLSCLACHQKHGQRTRQSCADCHPRLSNCGLDVEKMDTTFFSDKSKHNVHFVKCADCHPKGVPAKKKDTGRVAEAPVRPPVPGE